MTSTTRRAENGGTATAPAPKPVVVLRALLAIWRDYDAKADWYQRWFLPAVIADHTAAARSEVERELLADLHAVMSEAQWRALPANVSRVAESSATTIVKARGFSDRALLAGVRGAGTARQSGSREPDAVQREPQAAGLTSAKRASTPTDGAWPVAPAQMARRHTDGDRALLVETAGDGAGTADSAGGVIVPAGSAGHAAGVPTDPGEGAAVAGDSAGVAAVLEWAQRRHPDFTPTPEQAAVIAANGGHALVEARAGSGKTATMIARAAYLIEECGVSPDGILMLAFNNSAAVDLRRRAAEWLPDDLQPHIMTLDALAFRIERPTQRVLAEDADRRVEELVREMWRDPAAKDEMRELVLSFVRADADGDARTRFWSLRGDSLPSRAAQSVADALLRSGFGGATSDFRFHRSSGVFELLDGQGGTRLRIGIIDPRRPFAADLRYEPSVTTTSGFTDRLRQDLKAAGIAVTVVDDDALWEAIRQSIGERFLRAITQIVMRARQRLWTGADLLDEWRARDGDESRRGAIELAARMLDLYIAALAEADEEDFPGIVWRAAARLDEGRTAFAGQGRSGDVSTLTHIVIDEFQDFTPRFDALIQAVLARAPRATVMAVGDDWQAINEFAGSSTRYFTDFAQHFPGAVRLRMLGNRRSGADIVASGNSVMATHPHPAQASTSETGRIRQFAIDEFEPTPDEQRLGRPTTVAVMRLIKEHLDAGRTVAVLARTREVASGAATGLERVVSADAAARCDIGTIHSYKGREADAVILVGVAGWAFPHLHPTWQLGRVFGDTFESIVAAERRLLYVGVSRPRRWLDIVTGRADDPSPLWEPTAQRAIVHDTDWAAVAPAIGAPAARRATVRVYNGMYDGRWLLSWDDFHESKAALVAAGGFRYEPAGGRPHWVGRMDAAQLRTSGVLEHAWAQFDGIRIEVEWPDRGRQVYLG